MIFLSIVLACLLIGSGLSAVFLGSGMIVLERGWSMVIAGSVVATGGVILLGIAMLIREVRRLPERLADTWSETLPIQHVYTDNDRGQQTSDTAVVSQTQRPRIDHELSSGFEEPERPEPPAFTPFAFPAKETAHAPDVPDNQVTKAAHDIPPALQIPKPALRDEPAIASEGGQAVSSALKIQISLHNNAEKSDSNSLLGDLPSAKGFDRPESKVAVEPVVKTPEPANLSGAGKPAKSFWSRLGRNDKATPEPSEPIVPAVDSPTEETVEPTAADLARSRLVLADTPEPEPAENATLKVASPKSQDAKTERKEPSIGLALDAGNNKAAPEKGIEPVAPDAGISAGDTAKKPVPPAPTTPKRKPDAADVTGKNDNAGTKNASPAVIGSYRAGPNLFVMYDDGTIESETPDGIFRFASLDKLKTYISSGEDPALAGERVHRPPTENSTASTPVSEEKPAI